MIVLALDTALQACSLAIIKDGAVLFDEFNSLEKGHAEVLPPLVARALETADIRPDAIDRVGVTIGPGGFTGLRVGLAFARGFVIGRKCVAVGIDTLSALRQSYAPLNMDDDALTAVVVDARRGEVFAALYGPDGPNNGERVSPFAATPGEAADALKAEAGAEPVHLIDPSNLLPAPADWSRLPAQAGVAPVALARMAAAATPDNHPPAPLYLRAPDAKPSKETAAALFESLPS